MPRGASRIRAAWTSEELRVVLVRRVGEDGMTLRDALESLREVAPPVPAYWTLFEWLSVHSGFRKDYQIAKRMRAELLAEAATEAALNITTEAEAKIAKVQMEQLRWHASKLDRDTFGDHRTVENLQPMAGVSDQDLDQRIKALMADNGVRNALESQGIRILDAEIVSENEIP